MKCNNPFHEEFNGEECACIDCHPEIFCVDDPCVYCDGPVKKRCDPTEILNDIEQLCSSEVSFYDDLDLI